MSKLRVGLEAAKAAAASEDRAALEAAARTVHQVVRVRGCKAWVPKVGKPNTILIAYRGKVETVLEFDGQTTKLFDANNGNLVTTNEDLIREFLTEA